MNENQTYYQSGLAVVIGLFLFVASVIYFSGNKNFLKKYNHYEVRFQNVQGLNVGSVVSFTGIDIGNIDDIRISPSGEVLTRLKIDREYKQLITEHVVASIRTQGALGDKYIFLNRLQTDGRQLNSGDEIKADTQPDFLDMLSGKTTDLDLLKSTLSELKILLTNLNAGGNSARLIEGVANSSHTLNHLLSQPDIKASFTHLKNILHKIDKGDGTLGLLVNDPTIHKQIVHWVGSSPQNSYLKPLLREAIKQNERQK